MVHVGDKVKIVSEGEIYTTYPGFLEYYKTCSNASVIVNKVCEQYVYGYNPTQEDIDDRTYTVMFVRKHGSMDYTLAIINDGEKTFIINVCGLSVISSDLPFEEGDKVFIKENESGRIYSCWREVITHMSTLMPDGQEVLGRWISGHSPAIRERGESVPYTVKWIGHHIARPEEAAIAVISNGKNTFIIDTVALASFNGQSVWDKYLIYIRNWAVTNPDAPSEITPYTGPKSYSRWLADK